MDQHTTIAAVSTPRQKSGVAVVRISGRDAKSVAARVFRAIETAKPRQMVYGEIIANGITDRAMGVYFAAPHSFTGEDTVELYPHGSLPVLDAILDACYAAGAVAAGAGEFTMRAFLNGKLDLTAAEGIADLIDAETETEARAAARQMSGALRGKIEALSARLTDIIAAFEAVADYPEEGLEDETADDGLPVLCGILADAERLISGYREGRMLRGGVRVAVVGPPNTGKSTLLNALLGYDRAIVTATPGTTRDTIEESYIYNGVRFSVTDTAGIRETSDEIEQQGIGRALTAASEADIVLSLREAGKRGAVLPVAAVDVQNKTDIFPPDAQGTLTVSAATGEGIERLKAYIFDATAAALLGSEGAYLNNRRQLSEVTACATHLKRAIEAARDKRDTELIAFDLMAALKCLCRVTGRDGIDEVTAQIFARFCVGK